MFKWIVSEMRMSRVLKRVPAALRSGWGPHDFYTAGQVKRVCSDFRFGDTERRLALALACTRDEFQRGLDGDVADYQPLRTAWRDRLELPENWDMGHVFRRQKTLSSSGGEDEGSEI